MRRYALWTILLLCFFTVACSNINEDDNYSNAVVNNAVEEDTGDSVPIKNVFQEDTDIIIGYADLTHDGVNEKISLDVSSIEETQEVILKISEGEDNIIWQESACIPHVGWNSLYLCTIDGKDWILRYNPYMNQGWADYSYQLFSIDEQGKENTVKSGSVNFSISGEKCELDTEKMVYFYNEINNYLDKSVLLMSTEGGNLEYGSEGEKITKNEEFSWLYNISSEYAEDDSLIDKIEKYQQGINSNISPKPEKNN